MLEVIAIDPKCVHEVWPSYRPWIDTAMRRGDLSTIDSVEADVLEGNALLWLACKDDEPFAAAVTELHELNDRRLCVIVACGGKKSEEWATIIERIEQYAHDEACDAVRLMGRVGWQRLLPAYAVQRVLLEKEL